MENKELTNSANDSNKPDESEIQKIEERVEELVSWMEEINSESDKFRLEWHVGSKELTALKNYRQFLCDSDTNPYKGLMEFENYFMLFVDTEDVSMTILIRDWSYKDKTEIQEVTKFIFNTAKSYGSNYHGLDLDIIFDDDDRYQY